MYYEEALMQLHLPSLNTLTLGNRSDKDILQCPRDICERVTKVRLCLQTLSSPQLYEDLENFNHLESLEIYDTPPSLQFFKRFEAGHELPPLCPTLRRLSIDFFKIGHAIPREELVVVFQNIVESRRLTRPLLSLRVQWSRSTFFTTLYPYREKEQGYPIFQLLMDRSVIGVDRPRSPAAYSDCSTNEMQREKSTNETKDFILTSEELESEIKEAQRNAVDFVLSGAAELSHQGLINSPNDAPSVTRLLPNELIGEVFLRCVRDGGTSPWALAGVNQRFRRIAFDTRKLWSAITIPASTGHYRPYTYSKSRHHCADIQSLHYILSLSGNAPLDIVIEQITIEVASALIQERERWDTVEIFTPYTAAQAAILLDSTIPHTVRKVVFGWEAPVAFHWLETVNPVSLSIHADVLLGGRWWTRLQEFSFSRLSPWITLSPTTRNNLLRVLQGVCTQLTYLQLVMIPFPSQTSLQFPRLRELSVEDVEGWQLIECSNLTRLKLGNVYSIDGFETTYPNVRELDLSMWYRDGALIQLGLPGLDTLIVNEKFHL
ncbi:hypothetical protein FRC17_002680 [Serendipita sp. 399]|nr:hypothetical protein FRC17_002680 [Serendipita sp. 399]